MSPSSPKPLASSLHTKKKKKKTNTHTHTKLNQEKRDPKIKRKKNRERKLTREWNLWRIHWDEREVQPLASIRTTPFFFLSQSLSVLSLSLSLSGFSDEALTLCCALRATELLGFLVFCLMFLEILQKPSLRLWSFSFFI